MQSQAENHMSWRIARTGQKVGRRFCEIADPKVSRAAKAIRT